MVFFIADSEREGSGRPKPAASSGGNVTCKTCVLIIRTQQNKIGIY